MLSSVWNCLKNFRKTYKYQRLTMQNFKHKNNNFEVMKSSQILIDNSKSYCDILESMQRTHILGDSYFILRLVFRRVSMKNELIRILHDIKYCMHFTKYSMSCMHVYIVL